jgi:hypothetical protein
MSLHDYLSLAVSAIVFALLLCTLVFQALTGVPPAASNATEAADIVALLRTAGLRDGAVIYELGAGWGSLVLALARAFPEADIRGVELSPLPFCVAWLRTRGFSNVTLLRKSFYDCDLGDADAVTCYLMTRAMPRLAALLDRRLAPGTPVVTLSFWFRERTVTASLSRAGILGAAALYHWPARHAPSSASPPAALVEPPEDKGQSASSAPAGPPASL